MNTSAEINELAKALSEAQAKIKHAAKDSKNPHYRSSYASLASVQDACREQLSSHGLAVTQATILLNNQWVLVTRLMHTSGQFIESQTPIINSKGDAQGFGSALTYARRYALSSLVGVAQDDDDANEAVGKVVVDVDYMAKEGEKQSKDMDPRQYMVTFGKFKDKRLGEIDMSELKSYVEFIELSAKRTDKPITGEQAKMMSYARQVLGLFEKTSQGSNGAQ
jgi:hypothetical protein